MNPDFDYLFWQREVEHGLSLAGGISGEHVTHDGRLCCHGKQPAYEIMVTAYVPHSSPPEWRTRKLSEVRL